MRQPEVRARKFGTKNGSAIWMRSYSFKSIVAVSLSDTSWRPWGVSIQTFYSSCNIHKGGVGARGIIRFVAKLPIRCTSEIRRTSSDNARSGNFLLTRVDGVHMRASNSVMVLVLQIKIRPSRTSFQSLDKISKMCRFYTGAQEREEGTDPRPETHG